MTVSQQTVGRAQVFAEVAYTLTTVARAIAPYTGGTGAVAGAAQGLSEVALQGAAEAVKAARTVLADLGKEDPSE